MLIYCMAQHNYCTGEPVNAFPNPNNTDQTGMSLRDYIAVASLQGMVANDGYSNPWQLARYAYSLADAMLEVKNEDNKQV